MKNKTIALTLLLILSLFSCEEDIPTDPRFYVGRYTLQYDTVETQVNIRSSQPGANTGIILKWENQESTDTIAHYEILKTAYHIYDWNLRYNGGYVIAYHDNKSFHIESDSVNLFFNPYQ